MSTSPWNGKPVTIVKSDDGATLSIRQSKEGDNPGMVFETKGENAQLQSLFATLAGSGLPVKSTNFVMYGEKRGENGRPLAIMTKHTQPYVDKRDGKEKVGMYAYDPKQLDAFVPLSFVILTKWMPKKGGNGKYPVPLFLAHATPYERTRTVQDMGFERVTVAKANDDVAPLVRRTAKPVAASKA